MLYMIIERTSPANVPKVGERFNKIGRMLPDGVLYHMSWLNEDGSVCYQVMEAEARALIDVWISRWSDLVSFEVVPVFASEEYWARRAAAK